MLLKDLFVYPINELKEKTNISERMLKKILKEARSIYEPAVNKK